MIYIIGGGITGMAIAYNFLKKNLKVTIIEKNKTLGGLADSIKINNTYIEKYYHHIFKGDDKFLSLVKELGLEDKLIWNKTKMGFYCNEKVYNFGTPTSLLKFKPLDFRDRIRFGKTILSFRKSEFTDDLDNISAEEILIKKSGKEAYEKLWKPLLKAKFGYRYQEASAAWLLGRIKPRAESRTTGMSSELLGYMTGGFHLFFEELKNKILDMGGTIIERKTVSKILVKNEKVIGIIINGKKIRTDKVIYTGSVSELTKICKFNKEYSDKLNSINYQAILCVLLEIKEKLSDIYWLNIADDNIVFGGVIEHTNFVSKSFYGNNMVYLFNYLDRKDPKFKLPDKEIIEIFLKDLKKIFPDFNEDKIVSFHVFKDPFATPIYDKGFGKRKPDYITPINGLFIAGMTDVYPFDRNMDGAVRIAEELTNLINED